MVIEIKGIEEECFLKRNPSLVLIFEVDVVGVHQQYKKDFTGGLDPIVYF